MLLSGRPRALHTPVPHTHAHTHTHTHTHTVPRVAHTDSTWLWAPYRIVGAGPDSLSVGIVVMFSVMGQKRVQNSSAQFTVADPTNKFLQTKLNVISGGAILPDVVLSSSILFS